jgi:hypothetical protein
MNRLTHPLLAINLQTTPTTRATPLRVPLPRNADGTSVDPPQNYTPLKSTKKHTWTDRVEYMQSTVMSPVLPEARAVGGGPPVEDEKNGSALGHEGGEDEKPVKADVGDRPLAPWLQQQDLTLEDFFEQEFPDARPFTMCTDPPYTVDLATVLEELGAKGPQLLKALENHSLEPEQAKFRIHIMGLLKLSPSMTRNRPVRHATFVTSSGPKGYQIPFTLHNKFLELRAVFGTETSQFVCLRSSFTQERENIVEAGYFADIGFAAPMAGVSGTSFVARMRYIQQHSDVSRFGHKQQPTATKRKLAFK